MVGRFGQERNSASGRKLGKQSVSVQTISNPQVAGSNPAGRARKLKPPYGGFYFMYDAPGFEPAKKQFEPPQKGGRQYAGLRQQILPGGAAILLGVPEN